MRADDLARLAERLNGRGAVALAGLSDREVLAAWEDAVAAFLDPGSPERRKVQDRLLRGTRLSPAGLEAGLQAVLGGVRGAPAARLFAEATALRGDGRDTVRQGRTLRASARPNRIPSPAAPRGPLALIVLAGNLPALAVQPLLPALASRRPALLKSPSAEPAFAPAFVAALARRLPALGEALRAAVWPGGDEALEAPLLARAGVVLAYGDEEAVASLERRARQAGSARFVGYGPKTSLAAVGAEALRGNVEPDLARNLARGLARDVALFDQRGCLSVAAVYVEGDDGAARGFADALAGELGRLARELPPGPADAAAAGAVRQVRGEAEVRGLHTPPVGAGLAAGTVVVEPRPKLRPSPGLRTVRVHPLADLARLPEVLAPWRGRLQGAALAGAAAEALAPALAELGVSRTAVPGRLQHPDALWHNGGVSPLEALLGP